jgi:hypothetical protein
MFIFGRVHTDIEGLMVEGTADELYDKTGNNVWPNVTRRRTSATTVPGKSIKYSECVFVALGIQHAVRMCHIFAAACLAVHCSSTLSHKQNDFGKKVTEHKMCVLISSTIYFRNISHSKKK